MNDRAMKRQEARFPKGHAAGEARKQGRAARIAKESYDACPLARDYPSKEPWEAWHEGWREADAELRLAVAVQPAPIVSQEPKIMTPGSSRFGPDTYWPKGDALPQFCRDNPPLPCPSCLRLTLSDGGRAVAVITTQPGSFKTFQCKACSHRFRLPIKEGGKP